jgi:hypothetical protein
MSDLTVANEFAEVSISVVPYGNGQRLEIWSQRWGSSIWLDAVELEALTWQPKALFSKLLEGSVRP